MKGIFTTKARKAVRCSDEYDPSVMYYMDSYADFGGDVGKVYDYKVADYAKKHMRFIDRFNMRKIASAMMYSFSILSKSTEEPDFKNGKWKFYKD